MLDLALSLMVLAGFALVGGAVWLWRARGFTKQVLLMLMLAVVMAVNVASWTLPEPGGETMRETAKTLTK